MTFFKISFFQNCFRNTIRVTNGLDPDQDQIKCGPDLGPNCLQRSADDKIHLRKGELKGPTNQLRTMGK